MADVTPGKQYLGVPCRNCGQLAPLFEVDQGAKLEDFEGEFDVEYVECVHCGHEAAYPASELRMITVHRKH